jgi:hypothetical protein
MIIDSLATAVGDKATAKLARDILRDEERMQKFLAQLLPELPIDVAHDEIPVSEIEGEAAHRSASSTKTEPRSTTSRSARSRKSPAGRYSPRRVPARARRDACRLYGGATLPGERRQLR